MAEDWRATLNLPETSFPMKADLPRREPIMQQQWAEEGLYASIRAARRGAPKFILHDGPPYVNGNVHMGHALNKSLKDFMVRYHTLRGMDAPYVPGWDTHGLPIELQTIRHLHLNRDRAEPLELRAQCQAYALSFLATMTEQFQRLGVLGDWDHPYITLQPGYEAEEVRAFGRMAERGLIYRGLRPVYWCCDCQTALAEAEIEFHPTAATAVTVLFPVEDGMGRLPEGTAAAIWTTTPWTLPANTGITVHPDFTYVVTDSPRGPVLVAESRLPALWGGREPGAILARLRGSQLAGMVCSHPFLSRLVPIVLGEYVTAEEGTGLVHTAPGHGRDDFETGQRYGLPTIQPLDDRGRFGPEAGELAGLSYREAEEVVLRLLTDRGRLWSSERIEHEYAHCWRCKEPVIWRATEQWFVRMDALRTEAVAAAERVRWFPSWGGARMAEMVKGRQDWCVSRQRVWGVPIPVLYCVGCGQPLLLRPIFDRVAEVIGAEGADAWWRRPASDFLPQGVACPHCGERDVRKEADILDVWFDSGSSSLSVLAADPTLAWPADVYLEGPDQFRGWFQSSLLIAVAVAGAAPYRSVVTNGWVLDAQGRAMHKSLGNVIEPAAIVQRWGADVLRLWAASVDYTTDVRVSEELLTQVGEIYRKIRNTIRYLLGNLSDFDPDADALPVAELPERDRYILHRLAHVVSQVEAAYEANRFSAVFSVIRDFCAQDLSSFYLDVAKDRLYCARADDPARRATQTAMEAILRVLILVSAPILPHTADEAWRVMRHRMGDPGSVHLALWPEIPSSWIDTALARRWDTLLRLRVEVSLAVEHAIADGTIGRASEAVIDLSLSPEDWAVIEPIREELADQLLVSEVVPTTGGESIGVRATAAPRCARCWRHRPAATEALCERCAQVVGLGEGGDRS